MSKENITFRLESEKRVAQDEIVAGLDRDRTYVLNEAIDLYLCEYLLCKSQSDTVEVDTATAHH